MKKLFYLFLFTAVSMIANAQTYDPKSDTFVSTIGSTETSFMVYETITCQIYLAVRDGRIEVENYPGNIVYKYRQVVDWESGETYNEDKVFVKAVIHKDGKEYTVLPKDILMIKTMLP